MGKLRIILYSPDLANNAECMAYVYKNEEECVGKITTYSSLECVVDKDCSFSFCINGVFSKEVKVSANGDYNIVVEYSYRSDCITKIGVYDSKSGEEKTVRINKNNVRSHPDNKAPNTASTTMFEKLKEYGGWVNLVYCITFAVLLLSSIITFFVLVGKVAGVAFIVLGSGLLACWLLYLGYILAGYFYFAARDKGYEDLHYLFFPFVFPVIGYLLVIALPDRGGNRNYERKI